MSLNNFHIYNFFGSIAKIILATLNTLQNSLLTSKFFLAKKEAYPFPHPSQDIAKTFFLLKKLQQLGHNYTSLRSAQQLANLINAHVWGGSE